MKNRLSLLAAALTAFLFTPVAHAAEYRGLTMAQLQTLLSNQGVSASAVESDALQTSDGLVLWLTECNDAGLCAEIRLSRTFSDVRPTLEAVNRWNWEKKIPEASVSTSGSLHLEMWITTIGMTDAGFQDTVGWFESAWRDEAFWAPYFTNAGA